MILTIKIVMCFKAFYAIMKPGVLSDFVSHQGTHLLSRGKTQSTCNTIPCCISKKQ